MTKYIVKNCPARKPMITALEQRIYKRLENFEERLISTLDYAIKKWAQN